MTVRYSNLHIMGVWSSQLDNDPTLVTEKWANSQALPNSNDLEATAALSNSFRNFNPKYLTIFPSRNQNFSHLPKAIKSEKIKLQCTL